MLTVPVRIISKNIRYATHNPFEGEEFWTVRKEHLINELRFNSLHNPSALICCQEVLYEQLQDILHGLKVFDDWAYIGWGRDDGKKAGEFCPIFYRPRVWVVLEQNPIWLSPTPDIPSKDPDAGSIRVLTRAKLKHRSTGLVVMIYSTHLDDASSKARNRAARIICDTATKDAERPIILAADLNSEENQEAYRTIIHHGLLHDASRLTTTIPYGNYNTYTGFSSEDPPPRRIDYILCSHVSGTQPRIKVQDFAVLANWHDDGIHNSDHRAVVADILITIK